MIAELKPSISIIIINLNYLAPVEHKQCIIFSLSSSPAFSRFSLRLGTKKEMPAFTISVQYCIKNLS